MAHAPGAGDSLFDEAAGGLSSISTAPWSTISPTRALIFFTTAGLSALSVVSIFIASITTSGCPASTSLGRDKFEGCGTRRDENRVAATRAENPGASPVHPDDRASVLHRLDLRRDLLAVNSHPRRAPVMRDNLDVEFTRAACEPQLHRRPQTSKPASPLHGDRPGEPLAPGRIPFEAPPPAVPAPCAAIAAAINAALSASSPGCHRGKNSSRKRVESFASANGPLATTSRKNAAVFLIPSSANSSSAATVRARACSRSSPKQISFATRLS